MEINTLHETDWLCLMEMKDPDNGVNGYVYAHAKWCSGQGVAILPYRRTEDGGIEFLLRQEVTPCWGMEPVLSSITGGMDKEGEDPAKAAGRELKEESGYDCGDINRWRYLGQCYSNKASDSIVYLFAVDLTGLEKTDDGSGDGTELEAKAWCEWREDPQEALDPLVGTMCLRLAVKGE